MISSLGTGTNVSNSMWRWKTQLSGLRLNKVILCNSLINLTPTKYFKEKLLPRPGNIRKRKPSSIQALISLKTKDTDLFSHFLMARTRQWNSVYLCGTRSRRPCLKFVLTMRALLPCRREKIIHCPGKK